MTRADVAVIMARGRSRRMGRAKGLVQWVPDGPPLVRIIADTYRAAGIPFLVVTLPDLAAAYGAAVGEGGGGAILPAEPGGDTARTMVLARRFLAGEGVTHLWAHPVAMPLVQESTLVLLRKVSRLRPTEVVRPALNLQPGHPVILPETRVKGFEALDGWREGSVRDLLAGDGFQKTRMVWVDDHGVVSDFDRPEDLPPGSPTSPGRGVT